MEFDRLNKSKNATAIINIFSAIIMEGVIIITAPIFTRILGTEQYGLYTVFNSWLSFLGCFMGLKVDSSLATAKYRFTKDYYAYRSSVLFFGTLICAIFIITCIIFKNDLSARLGYPSSVVILLFIIAFCSFVIDYAKNCFVYEKKPLQNFVFSFSISLTSVCLSLWLICNYDKLDKYVSRIYGTAAAYICGTIVMWIVLFIKKPCFFNKEYWKYAFLFGAPIVFHTLSRITLVHSDRIMMQWLGISNSEIGVYGVYYSLASSLVILLSALNTSWCPFFYDDLKINDWKAIHIKTKNFNEVFTVLTCGFLLLSREVGYWFAGEEYNNGINIVPLIVISIYLTFMYHFPVNFEYYHGKTKIIAGGSMVSAIVNIILNRIMIPPWGMYGAAFATALSYALLFIFHYIIVKNMRDTEYNIKIQHFALGIAMVIVTILFFYFMKTWIIIRWGLGAAIGIIEIYRVKRRKAIF